MARIVELPLEIQLEICAYSNPLLTSLHPLDALALTCKHFRIVVEEYCRNCLKKHANFTPPKSHTFTCRKKWLAETCQLCFRKSRRRAILHSRLTCCRGCDRQYFPKITMSDAQRLHSLSKLDLFTPNALHPSLPPLTVGAHTNLYASSGVPVTMILESDVIARKAHIGALLGPIAEKNIRSRLRAHDRIVSYMGLLYHPGRGWCKKPMIGDNVVGTADEKVTTRSSKSIWTLEEKREYVRKALVKEWEAMGMRGVSKDYALMVDEEGDEEK